MGEFNPPAIGGCRNVDLSRRVLGFRQHQLKLYIEAYLALHGVAPCYREIRDELGFSDNGKVHRAVKGLERRGLIRRVGAGRVRRIHVA